MRKVLLAVMASLFACAAQAQMVEVDRVDVQALACLEKTGPVPRYPAADERMRQSGHVRLSLKFTAPGRAPEVEVLFRAATEEMVDEIRWYVRGYRLPCMPAGGAPVQVVQEFEFKPRVTDPITWTLPRAVAEHAPADTKAADRSATMSCIRTPQDRPEFSPMAMQRDVGNAFVQIRFTAPDAPPEVKMVYASVGSRQERQVIDYVSQYRLPCLPAGARPLAVLQHFQFQSSSASARVFKDAVPLKSFLSNIKGIRAMRAEFDFNTMSCPFQVAWTLGKPALDNRVGELGNPDLNRTEFLAWLAGLKMTTKSSGEFEQLVGQTLIVNVPCGKLALDPQT